MGFFDSSGSTTTTQKAAAREPDYQKMWDQFVNEFYGAEFDPDYYLRVYPDVARYYKGQRLKEQGYRDADELPNEALDSLPVDGYLRTRAREHWEKYGKSEGRRGWSTGDQGPTLQDKFIEDNAARETADRAMIDNMTGISGNFLSNLAKTTQDRIGANQQYGQDMTGTTKNYLSQLTKDTGQYRNTLSGLMDAVRPMTTAAPVNFRAGDWDPISITSQHTRNAQDRLSGLAGMDFSAGKGLSDAQYDKGGALSQLINALAMDNAGFRDALSQTTAGQKSDLAQMQNITDKTYTPNAGRMQYLQWLMDNAIQPNEKARYAIPTMTESGEYSPSGMGILGDIAGIASQMIPK